VEKHGKKAFGDHGSRTALTLSKHRKSFFLSFFLFFLVKKKEEEGFFGVNLVFDVTWITQSFIDSKKVQ
jgi:hypothetical protein